MLRPGVGSRTTTWPEVRVGPTASVRGARCAPRAYGARPKHRPDVSAVGEC